MLFSKAKTARFFARWTMNMKISRPEYFKNKRNTPLDSSSRAEAKSAFYLKIDFMQELSIYLSSRHNWEVVHHLWNLVVRGSCRKVARQKWGHSKKIDSKHNGLRGIKSTLRQCIDGNVELLKLFTWIKACGIFWVENLMTSKHLFLYSIVSSTHLR